MAGINVRIRAGARSRWPWTKASIANIWIIWRPRSPPGSAGVRIVVDGANGSATYLGPALLERLGAQVESHPLLAGREEHQSALRLPASGGSCARKVLATGADLGVAFDGDADRALFVSHSGKIVDGDAVLLLTALPLHARGRLTEVVATVMSNLGLERALKHHGIGLVRTAVGDKYVLEEMLRRKAPLGGEQSGHIIFRDYATTGDGLLTASARARSDAQVRGRIWMS